MNATATENHVSKLEIWLIRHGETEWSRSGQHTGRTDIPLTDHGREQARALRPVLAAQPFDLVLCSPMSRARDTCAEAGLGAQAEEEPRLSEWNYGIYEGRTTKDIRAEDPDWAVWTSPIPEGETYRCDSGAGGVADPAPADSERSRCAVFSRALPARSRCLLDG